MKRIIPFLVLVAMMAVTLDAEAQNRRMRRNGKYHAHKRMSRHMSTFTQRYPMPKNQKVLTVGGGIGLTNYFGDLVPNTNSLSTDIRMTRWNLSGFVQKRMNYNISLRLGLQFARLAGSDFTATKNKSDDVEKYRWGRNLHFRNDVIEMSFAGIFDLYGSRGHSVNRHPLIPYGMLGIAAFYHNPKAVGPVGSENEGQWTALADLETEPGKEYSKFQFAIPVGLGVRYRATDKIDIGAEIGYRFTFTDYLDDVSTTYFSEQDMRKAFAEGDGEKIWFSNRTMEREAYTNSGTLVERDNADIMTVVGGAENIGNINGYSYHTAAVEKGLPRGNSEDNDFYVVTNFTVSYILGSTQNRRPKYR